MRVHTTRMDMGVLTEARGCPRGPSGVSLRHSVEGVTGPPGMLLRSRGSPSPRKQCSHLHFAVRPPRTRAGSASSGHGDQASSGGSARDHPVPVKVPETVAWEQPRLSKANKAQSGRTKR